jgi:hypothetical protein
MVHVLVDTPFLFNSFSALVSGRTLKVSRCIEEVSCGKILKLLQIPESVLCSSWFQTNVWAALVQAMDQNNQQLQLLS